MQSDARPHWRAMRHVDYREWAKEALGDPRQVYARDVRESADAPLIYMGPGEAKRFYADARAGRVICPVPGCPSPDLTTRASTDRRHHFVHRQSPGDAGHGRAYMRKAIVRLLHEWIAEQSPLYGIREDPEVSGVRATLLVRSPRTGRQVALMYVDGRYGVDAWEDDYVRLKEADVPASWIFAPRRMFFSLPKPSSDAGPDDPVARDRDRGDLVLDKALYRGMRSVGLWPLLISLERREFANLITPTGHLAGPLGLQPPESGDRVLHLVPSRLHDARLTRYGVETPAVRERFMGHAWQQPPPPPPPPPPVRSPPPEPPAAISARPQPTQDVALPDLIPSPLPSASRPVVDTREQRWRRGRKPLFKQLADPGLVDELATPLPTDVECDLLAVHWHTMLAVWLQRSRRAENAAALRRRLADVGAGPKLTTAAVEGFIAWWEGRLRR